MFYFLKKCLDVANVVLYHCVNFQKKMLYFRLSESDKIS
jgi:hypothetical protein